MIDLYPEGGARLDPEAVIGRIALVSRSVHWEACAPVGRVVAVEGRNFVIQPLDRVWDAEKGNWSLTGGFREAEEDRDVLNRRSLRMPCDTVDEARAMIEIDRSSSAAFNRILEEAKASVSALVEESKASPSL